MTPAEDINADLIVDRLQSAFLTMAALPGRVGPQALSAQSYGYVADVLDAPRSLGETPRNRISVSGRDITEMDEAMAWLGLVENRATRRIIAMRSVVNRETRRPLISWRAIGDRLNCSHVAAMNWYAAGIDGIVEALRKKNAGIAFFLLTVRVEGL